MKRHFVIGSILQARQKAEFVDFTGQRKGSVLWGVSIVMGVPRLRAMDGLFHGTSQSNMDDLGLSCG